MEEADLVEIGAGIAEIKALRTSVDGSVNVTLSFGMHDTRLVTALLEKFNSENRYSYVNFLNYEQ